MMEMRHHDPNANSAWESHDAPERGPAEPQVEPLRRISGQWLPDQQAVAVFRPACPRAQGCVAGLPRCADQPVLLHRIDHFLEPEDVRLQGGHVGEQERQPLEPAVGQVADIQGGDVKAVHRSHSGVV
jgi:hypothetical protein